MAMAFLQLMSGESVAALDRDGRRRFDSPGPTTGRAPGGGFPVPPVTDAAWTCPTGGMSTPLRTGSGSWPGARQTGLSRGVVFRVGRPGAQRLQVDQH
jgi:hypothetical protein